jgi:hypothetical protein
MIPAVSIPPSYHDLHITTETISRMSIFNLPFNLIVTCTRTGGWELWDATGGLKDAKLLAGEYNSNWIVLDVNGFILVDSRVKE